MSKMSKLRESARNRECQIRIPNCCNGNPETTVLCHLPGGGMGGKVPDFAAAYGCSACHDVVDFRVLHDIRDYPPRENVLEIKIYFLEGVIRTQKIMLEEGLITHV